jgi:hypothetical protein
VTNVLRICRYSSVYILMSTDIILLFQNTNFNLEFLQTDIQLSPYVHHNCPLNKEHLQCLNRRKELRLRNRTRWLGHNTRLSVTMPRTGKAGTLQRMRGVMSYIYTHTYIYIHILFANSLTCKFYRTFAK